MSLYVCKIDGAEFLEEQQLIEHIKNKYVSVLDTEIKTDGLSCDSIYKIFKNELPKYVDIDVRSDIEDGGYIVSITSKKFECDLSCQVGEGEWNYYYARYLDPAEAVNYYKQYFEFADNIIQKIKKEYSIILTVERMFESSGEGERDIVFSFHIDGQKLTEVYEFQHVDDFAKNFKQYISNVIEGKIEIHRHDYDTVLTIDGINIGGFISRSKKVRLEIIE
ncbi:hypothetical protein NV379_02035 [Paenibacillus sp. N1-5-1-14]|uniref:hypothetical protein n=1 Tax=Paenibacillus radicibacter TaxID=2972488 RepID=UPI0021592DAB|nr:hypothetical protein [Paenibacillus radicibacter]MCR8641425.1 hypothetical protein [Paenibacillus radicibacter]